MHFVTLGSLGLHDHGPAPEDSALEAAYAIQRNDRNPVIVERDGRAVGLVSEDDIIAKVLLPWLDPRKILVRDIMEVGRITADGQRLELADSPSTSSPIRPGLLIDEPLMVDASPMRGLAAGQCEECETDQDHLVEIEGFLLCEDCLPLHGADDIVN
jgi:hypothetical protein